MNETRVLLQAYYETLYNWLEARKPLITDEIDRLLAEEIERQGYEGFEEEKYAAYKEAQRRCYIFNQLDSEYPVEWLCRRVKQVSLVIPSESGIIQLSRYFSSNGRLT